MHTKLGDYQAHWEVEQGASSTKGGPMSALNGVLNRGKTISALNGVLNRGKAVNGALNQGRSMSALDGVLNQGRSMSALDGVLNRGRAVNGVLIRAKAVNGGLNQGRARRVQWSNLWIQREDKYLLACSTREKWPGIYWLHSVNYPIISWGVDYIIFTLVSKTPVTNNALLESAELLSTGIIHSHILLSN